MLFETAASEISLLIFSVLVPMGVTALGLSGFVRASADLSEDIAKKADALQAISGVITLVGLIAAFTHLGSPTHVFGMASGAGTSPLSNEIIVAGIAIVVAVVYWIFAAVKHPAENVHKAFGVALVALGLICALFTGLAYIMPTIATWNSPVATISQVCAALFSGAVLAALILTLAGAQGNKVLNMCACVGAVGMSIMVLVQGGMAANVVNAAGLTLEAVMGQYWAVAVISVVLACVAALLMFKSAKAQSKVAVMVAAALICLVACVLVRICFYGIFLSVGLF